MALAATTLFQVAIGHRLPLFEGPSTPYLAMLVVLVGLAVSACQPTPAPNNAPAPTAAPAQAATGSGAPIKIGLVTGLSGIYAGLAQGQQRGAELAIDEVKTVLGRPLQLLPRDDKIDPGEAAKQDDLIPQRIESHPR